MLEIHPSGLVADRREANLDFARLREVRLITPLMRDLPSKNDAPWRIPREHGTPRTFGSVGLLCVAASTRPALDDRLLHRGRSDVMTPRPPTVEFGREDAERAIEACPHGDALANGRVGGSRCFGHRHFSSSSDAIDSMRARNDTSACPQNSSKNARSESKPSGLS